LTAPPVYLDGPGDASRPLAILGDTQRTLWVERLQLREQNDLERAKLVGDLARQRPGVIAALGDLVSVGSLRSQWESFDDLMEPIRARGIPLLPALGNHDYWGGRRALEHLQARFPQLQRSRWYARRHGVLGLVWLDSNPGPLGRDGWARQKLWLLETLQQMDGDAAVAAVLVFAHHPPFTNSALTRDEKRVQESFLPAFFRSRKALVFASGHVHAYERFRREGRTFLVCGGGGGPRVKLLAGNDRRHDDLYSGPSPRPFHYLMVEPGESALTVSVQGFGKGEPAVRPIDQFSLPFAGIPTR
jgi:hypothetical protein